MKLSYKHLIAVAAGAAVAVAGLNCAPVDAPDEAPPANTAPAAAAPESLPPPVLRPSAFADDWAPGLKTRVDAAIDQVVHRDLLTTNGFWTVFHGILGLGPSVTLLDPATGKRVVALDYIADGGEIRGCRFLPSPDGLDVETRPGTFVSQGHQDQFIAEMVEWSVSPDRKFLVNGVEHPFSDFTRFSKARASVKGTQELDWAILIIGDRYGTDLAWTNASGEKLTFEDLLRYQLDSPLDKAACGGTHRLFGLTWVEHLHLLQGGQATGIWKEVGDRTEHYKDLAKKCQNPDGSFSTKYFRPSDNSGDMNLHISTSGHIFEWLSLACSDDELRQPWMRDAANALSMMFLDSQGAPLEGGTLYHAVHGLLIYRSRVFGADGLGPHAPHEPLLPKEKANPS